jgi:hypothetical protein
MDLMEMPDVRTLQVMPKIETFALPKWDRLTVTPRLMTLPRVELLQTIPPML